MEKIIIAKNLSKIYIKGQYNFDSLKGLIHSKFRRTEKSSEENSFTALDNISFEVLKGDRICIIGKNGSGKSTLLKILNKITYPTNGSFVISDKMVSFLELGAGFHPEFTTKENIYLFASIYGMKIKDIDNIIDNVLDFSELRDFIDTPVKKFSSGMHIKLALSIFFNLKAQIFVLDEAFSVADNEFKNKCVQRLLDLNQDTTLVFVSHDYELLKKICNKAIVLQKGKIIFNGNLKDLIKWP